MILSVQWVKFVDLTFMNPPNFVSYFSGLISIYYEFSTIESTKRIKRWPLNLIPRATVDSPEEQGMPPESSPPDFRQYGSGQDRHWSDLLSVAHPWVGSSTTGRGRSVGGDEARSAAGLRRGCKHGRDHEGARNLVPELHRRKGEGGIELHAVGKVCK